jgi:hypothetical protein
MLVQDERKGRKMGRKTWLILVVAILLLGGGGYGACVAATGSDEALTMPDPVTDPPGHDPVAIPDAGRLAVEAPVPGTPAIPGVGVEAPEGFVGAARCGENTCAEGERCCYPSGTCYPIECQDCCDAERNLPTPDLRVTPEPGPRPAGPQPPPIP